MKMRYINHSISKVSSFTSSANIWKLGVSMYAFIQPLCQDQNVIRSQFLCGVQFIWIHCFPSPGVVAIPKFKSQVYLAILPIVGRRKLGFIPFFKVIHQPRWGFESVSNGELFYTTSNSHMTMFVHRLINPEVSTVSDAYLVSLWSLGSLAVDPRFKADIKLPLENRSK